VNHYYCYCCYYCHYNYNYNYNYYDYYSVGATVHDIPWRLVYIFLFIKTVGRIPWVADRSVSKPLPTQDNINTE
jgi:hypothetical protein